MRGVRDSLQIESIRSRAYQARSRSWAQRCLLASCNVAIVISLSAGASAAPYRITYNPYAGVNWLRDHRALSQHHDHAGTDEARIRAYDNAGYDVMPIMHYSGDPSVIGSWTQVRWPVAEFLATYDTDEEFLATLDHIKMFYPSAEKIGFGHIVAPFLTVYTEKYDPATKQEVLPHHYGSTQECIDRITSNGGLAIIAHPWVTTADYTAFGGVVGLEIYSAFAQHRYETGQWDDRNLRMLQVWDTVLTEKSSRTWGFAVNDWFGPAWSDASIFPTVADSGKTLVMLPEFTLPSYRQAIEAGAFFAVRDNGIVKRLYPTVTTITTNELGIEITTTEPGDVVVWIGNGSEVAMGPALNLAGLEPGLRYVRAEISNDSGTLYSQPFSIAGSGDFDESGSVDLRDTAAFQTCFGSEETSCTVVFDCNQNGIVDGWDLGTFESNQTGPRR